jgi:Asp-tRNA(Asn)/Glu-tRNA(Gln) amidotransferase A subunit family amidase
VTELHLRDATGLAHAVRTREVSPVEVLDAFLDRIDRLDPAVHAFRTVPVDAARRQARRAEAAVLAGEDLGALHGVPVAIKDLTPTRGIETSFGSVLFAGHVPDTDAIVVERTLAAGGIVIGKTMTSEFGHAASASNPAFGTTVNPWDPTRSPGGSSGGSAAAVAAALSPVAEGSDAGGSIRIPASCCGVLGLKPQLGRIPVETGRTYFETLACIGPLTWTTRDAALLMSVWAGPDERDPKSLPDTGEDWLGALDGDLRGLRVAWSPSLGLPADPEVVRIVGDAARTLERLGCSVQEIDLAADASLVQVLHRLWVGLEATLFGASVAEHGPRMTPGVLREIERGRAQSAIDVWEAEIERSRWYDRVRAVLDEHDVIVCPTNAIPPPPADTVTDGPSEIDGQPVDPKTGWTLAYPFNLTTHPAISVPCGTTADGLPVGMQVVARRFAERTLLRVAARVEDAAPWGARRPL